MHVLMVAAENDALPNAKVGGVADVVRDSPKALVAAGLTVDIVIPDYGFNHLDKVLLGKFAVPFAGRIEQLEISQVASTEQGIRQFIISHHEFSRHQGAVYCNDDDNRPFATDASKFALFNSAVCEAMLQRLLSSADVLHLHDWHSACVALLLKYEQRYDVFSDLFIAYTVHNLALQGIRPFNGDLSSLEAWYPGLAYNGEVLCDPRYPNCFNPMRAALNLVDKVHLVSPTYSLEVLTASHPENGYFGGEGLENDLKRLQSAGKLVGILNGCEYPQPACVDDVTLSQLYDDIDQVLLSWMAKQTQLETSHYIAHQRLKLFMQNPQRGPLMTSVGRLTTQKALLLVQPDQQQLSIDSICQLLAEQQGRLIMLGSGDNVLEQHMTQAMARNNNFLFLKGYAHSVGESLYQLGDVFLMPSSFEPCGISQMLAMRAGQPCLVHSVGGLRDTVKHLENGFAFSGATLTSQTQAMLCTVKEALALKLDKPQRWQAICQQAKAARFSWQQVAEQYILDLYQ
ncbi:glycogen synthase [Pseudoalteromonas mariniglutinosa]|uniref:glycogen synthase n=1 Tax=Pseudoalteromonas mariniglutinosa TaxID=206042 RepID=UPI003850681E